MHTDPIALAEPAQTARRADPTIGFRRIAGALALPTAFACQLVANTAYALATGGGIAVEDTAANWAAIVAHPLAFQISTWAALIGSLLAVAGLPAALRVLRPARPRLALAAVILMTAGYVCYFGLVYTGFGEQTLAMHGVDAAADAMAAAALTGLPFALVFVAGNLVGTLLLGVAAILAGRRSGPHPVAGILIIGWPVGHVINIIVFNEWFAVAGGALEVAGLALVAAAALRTRNEDWATRG